MMISQNDLTDQKLAIDNLNKEAWQYRIKDSGQALILSKNAVDLAEAIDYTQGKAEGYRSLGFSFIRLSRHKEANALLEKALDLFTQVNDLQGQSDVYEFLGIIKRSLGDYSASLEFLFKSLELRKQTSYAEGECLSFYHLGVTYKYLGDYDKALKYLLESLSIAQSIHYWVGESYSLNLIGMVYYETGAFNKALEYYHQSLAQREEAGDKWGEAGCLDNIGYTYFKLKDYKQAIDFCTRSNSICDAIGDKKGQSNSLFHLGVIYKDLNNPDKAKRYGHNSLEIRREIGDKKGEAEILLFLAEHFNDQDKETVLELLSKASELVQEVNALDLLSKIHFDYYRFYKLSDLYKESLSHFELFMEVEKKLHKEALDERIQNLEISHKAEQSRNEAEIFRLRNVELAALYEQSIRQKGEIEEQKKIAEESLTDLKTTQNQLIQREKMASLGELTAGIAHEIQNPLNFINNFSDVNKELIDEIKNELHRGNNESALLIADDIKENEQKINHHGKRADAIVKGMLQHARTSTGKKEPTDINALAGEYLQLSYHGFRAKDKFFNAEMETHFEAALKKININPQDMGRVLLNLYNNAFYSVSEKKKQFNASFVALVSVGTKRIKDKVEIVIRDNGIGIPHKMIDKIFQPFFTTKSAGQGTGLGLSMSYDIIKSHGGELKVETKEGEYAEFIIYLPV